ncbi:pentapeptide repeat-containing protein [Ruminococcus flavefaciens]|uniref:Uncharacterized protein YjbI with pentapeptide repeats n=1 Tax=Ruminococcus flavefaciens TaxID=1265 RepID=A0A315Y173_RUMFL|nr:pentapeptide repeat-containing protein [Ruminococcus flavefaciens]PWJ12195.1 uncharacterized protein YjbI with pentapeptide repeats [Ruminococcus flavefaciens]SSA49685.1 Uncharacterized protein YjbI, contains pentapeptide repeats [Ruminococcus flavefaciens]
MGIKKMLKMEYDSLTDKEKNNFKSFMIEALLFIPIVGQAANFFKSVEEWNKYKIEIIIPKIMTIAKPGSIDEDRQNKIAYALKKVFSDNYTKISEYVSVKRKEFEELIYDKYNECSLFEDDSAEIKTYIKDIIDVILDNIDMIETSESYGKTALKNTANHEKRITALEEGKQQETSIIHDNNDIFVQKYNDVLFLDKGRNPKIFLSDVYVDPIIKDSNISLYEQLRVWEKKPDETSRFYSEADAKVLLLFGKAGIGKSSLVAKLISQNFFQNIAHAIVLNKKTEKIDHDDPWGSIKKIYGCDDDSCYNNKVLILDGFDEVCVLKNKGFKGHDFLKKLTTAIPENIFVKILITSREHNGYFEKVEEIKEGIIIRQIEWEKDQLFLWCKNYLNCRDDDPNIKQWTTDFKDKFETLEDNLQDAFRSPIILYICCHENIEVFKLDSITDVYYQAFHKIVRREYMTSGRFAELNKTDEEMEALLWQYTKEIAYQIFLNSNEISTANADMIKKAKSFVNLENSEFDSKILDILPAVFHFTSEKGDGAVEFAHKTVVEYFIAVKIYEDYFKELDKEKDIDEVWCCIYEAFCYKFIPFDIFNNVFNMIANPDPVIQGNFDKQAFFEKFESGMKREKLMKCAVNCDEKYLKCINYNIDLLQDLADQTKSKMIDETFRNLTWFLNGLDYRNDSFTLLFKYLKPFLHIEKLNLSNLIFNHIMYLKTEDTQQFDDFEIISDKNIYDYISPKEAKLKNERIDINFNKANANIVVPRLDYSNLIESVFINSHMEYIIMNRCNLKNCSFEYADLRYANLNDVNLNDANLSKVNLRGANLCNADLSKANLSGANLCSSDLVKAILSSANLCNADLSKANLSGANLSVTNLSNADLSNADCSIANLINADLRYANLSDANLCNANLIKANLSFVNLSDANLSGANLSGANLRGANLIKACLINANLSFVNLSDTNLSFVNLSEDNLSFVNLSDADLSQANLNSVDLSFANLSGTNLSGTNLSNADLEGAIFENTRYNSKTKFPESFEIDPDKMIFVDEKNY